MSKPKTPQTQSGATAPRTDAAPFDQDPFATAYPETREFWATAADGRFLLKVCTDCQRAHWYPRVVCPLCGSPRTEWREASGLGQLYAFSPARRAEPPYILAYVTLDEGPTLLTNVVDARPEDLQLGQRVKVKFQAAAEGRLLPFFAPA